MSLPAGTRVLVTGATGFIGRHLTRRLVKEEVRLWTTGLSGRSPVPGQGHHFRLDIRDERAVRMMVEQARPQVVFHLAAAGVTDPHIRPALALAVNGGGTVNLLEALREVAVERVVLVGTCYEYGAREATEGLDPFNAYAASKVAAWAFGRMYRRVYRLPVIIVRPFQVYGPGQPEGTLIPAAVRAALAGDDFPITPGEQERDFVYVGDVVEGMIAAAVAPQAVGESLDLGTGRAHAVRTVAERIWALTGAQGRLLVGALPYRSGEVMHLVADAGRTAGLTGWRAAVGLDDGLRRTVDWIRKQSREVEDGKAL